MFCVTPKKFRNLILGLPTSRTLHSFGGISAIILNKHVIFTSPLILKISLTNIIILFIFLRLSFPIPLTHLHKYCTFETSTNFEDIFDVQNYPFCRSQTLSYTVNISSQVLYFWTPPLITIDNPRQFLHIPSHLIFNPFFISVTFASIFTSVLVNICLLPFFLNM